MFGVIRIFGVFCIWCSDLFFYWYVGWIGLVQYLFVVVFDVFDDVWIDFVVVVGEYVLGVGDFYWCDCCGIQGQGEVVWQFVVLEVEFGDVVDCLFDVQVLQDVD